MQQKIEDQFQLKYYRGSLYNVIFLEQFRKYLISMAITLCYALTIIHAWEILKHWNYCAWNELFPPMMGGNEFILSIVMILKWKFQENGKQLEKWWQFLGKISACLRLLPHVGNLYSTCFILLSSNYIKWNGIISNFSSWAIIIIFQTLE